MKVLHHDEPGAIGLAAEAEALIREARRRQRKRWALSVLTILFAAALTVGLVAGIGKSGTRPPAGSAPSGTGPLPGNAAIRSVSFPGPLVPTQVVSAAGALWVVGTKGSSLVPTCSIERIDPQTLHPEDFPLPACGSYVTSGSGLIYIAASHEARGSNNVTFRLETFDPRTQRAELMSPVITTVVGSSSAHLTLTYGAGSLWLSSLDRQLLQIAPSTGKVVRTISGVPGPPGSQLPLTANPGGVWVADGPGGGSANIYRMASGAAHISTVYDGPARSSIEWLTTVSGTVWADMATFGKSGTPVWTRLLAFDLAGRRILRTPSEPFGVAPLVSAGTGLYSIGSAGTCNTPQPLWRVDDKTGRAVRVATLSTPIEPCLTGQITSIGGSVFVLEATGSTSPHAVLYRIQAKSR